MFGAKLSVLLSWCQIVRCQIVLQSMKLCRKCVKYSGRTLLWCFFFFFHVLDSFNVIELISAFVWSLSLNLWNPHEMVLFLTSDKHKDLLIINRGGGCKTICTQIQQSMQTKQRKVEIFWWRLYFAYNTREYKIVDRKESSHSNDIALLTI